MTGRPTKFYEHIVQHLQINKYITYKMDMFTLKNCSIRPMLVSKHEKPYSVEGRMYL